MATPLLHALIRHLHRTAGSDGDASLTDGELLRRWAGLRDQAAFERLLRRHGPMVRAVCGRLLADPHAAEDAFQATWLVLVRKAESVRRPEALAAWLHRVAVRTALRARASAARRRTLERPGLVEAIAAPVPDGATGRELRAVLDDEIDRLPERHRCAFVLCCLEGKTFADAAAHLGRPVGTVASWAARARGRLRTRLGRRGLVGAAGAAAFGLTTGVATAGLPAPLVASTICAAESFAAGQAVPAGGVSARAAALAEGVLRAMSITRMKFATAAVLAATVIGLGAGGVARGLRADEPNPPAPRAAALTAKQPAAPVENRQPLLRVPMPDRTMMTVALSAQGNLLAVSRHDRTTIQLWDVSTGKEKTLTGHAFSVIALAFSPDNKMLASATGSWLPDGAPGEIKLWDVATGRELASLGKLPTMVLALAFSPDGKTLASASKTVKLWDVASRKEKTEFPVDGGFPWSLSFAPDGKTLAVGIGVLEDNTPGVVALWDLTTAKKRATLAGHVGAVPCVVFTPDGRILASADTRGTVKLWDVAKAGERASIPNPGHSFLLQSLVASADGKTVLGTCMGPQEAPDLKVWDVATGKERATFSGTPDKGFPLWLSGDGARVLLGSHPLGEGGQMELWKLQSLRMDPPAPAKKPEGAAPPENGKQLGWLADASRAEIPDRAAAGSLHGRPFKVGRARITPTWSTSGNVADPPEKQNRCDGAFLWLQQEKDNVARNSFTIFLTVKLNDTVDGKSFLVPLGGLFKQTDKIMDKDGRSWSYPVAGVQTESHDAAGKRRGDVMPKATMRLELGQRKNGRLPGKIYLCIDDKEKSFVAGSFEAEVEEKPDLEDAKKLFGAWQATGVESGREKLSAHDARIAFDYTHVTLHEGGRTTEADYRLDSEKTPKQIDLTLTEGENKGAKILGIYRLEGDTLTLYLGERGRGRPDGFTAEGEPGRFRRVLPQRK